MKISYFRSQRILVGVSLFLFSIYIFFPILWMIITSFKPNKEMYDLTQCPFIIKSFTLQHYWRLLTAYPFLVWIRNSLVVAFIASSISIVLGCFAGYGIAKLRVPGMTLIGLVIFATYLVPRVLLFLPLANFLQGIRLTNSVGSLIVTYPTFLIPFCTWLLSGYFASIPTEILECARIDGCSRRGAFVRIAVPLALPGILAAFIFSFTLCWIEYLYPLTFIEDSTQQVLTVSIVGQLHRGDVFVWGELMAAAVLTCIPISLLYVVLQKHFIRGLTAGAVKY